MFIKNTFILIFLCFSVSMRANFAGGVAPDHQSSIKETPNKTANKVSKRSDSKDLQNVFRKVKRVDNLFEPKKRLRKKKYTIA